MNEPCNLFVSPVEGVPSWWVSSGADTVSIHGKFPHEKHYGPKDEARIDSYRLYYGETSPHWREATREEAIFLLITNIHISE